MNNSCNHILLVEDDPLMREIITDMLEVMGYEVRFAENGKSGLQIYSATPDQFKLVVSDVDMPIMDGITMMSNILKINSEQKAIVISGVPDNERLYSNVNSGRSSFLAKPFSFSDMESAITQILG